MATGARHSRLTSSPLRRLRVGRIRAVKLTHVRDHRVDLRRLEHLAPLRHALLEHAVVDGLVDLRELPPWSQ